MTTLIDVDILIVDAFSLLFRAFHAFPLSLTSPSGELTNAVFGFTRLLLDALHKTMPEYLVVATDQGKPTFRHQDYVEYKANRPEAPHELTVQIDRLYEVLSVLNIPTIGVDGYEADDVIGTLAAQLRQECPELVVGILTGDRDAYQLVGGNVVVVTPSHQRNVELQVIDKVAVEKRFGILPDQVVDYKALCGDVSDNIPGVKGIGPKTAVQLLTKFGSLTRLYAALAWSAGAAAEVAGLSLAEDEKKTLIEQFSSLSPTVVRKLADSQESAWLSQRLARIDTAVPLSFTLASARLSDYDKERALALFDKLGFQSLKKRLPADNFEAGVQASLF